MKQNFTLFHAENINQDKDSVCHLIFIPVIDGEITKPMEFFANPEAIFDIVTSGITESEVLEFPLFADEWIHIKAMLCSSEFLICSSDGYSAAALCGTAARLGLSLPDLPFANAKAICRRTMDHVSYSLGYLSYKVFGDSVYEDDPVGIATRWAQLILTGTESLSAETFQEMLKELKIKPGIIGKNFKNSYCIKEKKRVSLPDIEVNAREDHPFYGMTVVFTGKMECMTRAEARTAVISIGGNSPDNITKDVDYLVVGVQDLRVVGEKGLSGKMKKAAQYREKGCDIEIIDENEFIEMMEM